VLRTYAAFLAGTSRMRWRRFLPANAAGGIVWAGVYTLASYLAGAALQRASGWIDLILGAAAVLAIAAVLLLLRRQMARLAVVPVPTGFKFQPVDTSEVATRLVELALGDPAGRVPDLAGPRVYTMSALLKSYLQAAGLRRVLLPLPLPGRAARAVRYGATLAPDHATGRTTWEQFLAAQMDAERAQLTDQMDAERAR